MHLQHPQVKGFYYSDCKEISSTINSWFRRKQFILQNVFRLRWPGISRHRGGAPPDAAGWTDGIIDHRTLLYACGMMDSRDRHPSRTRPPLDSDKLASWPDRDYYYYLWRRASVAEYLQCGDITRLFFITWLSFFTTKCNDNSTKATK